MSLEPCVSVVLPTCNRLGHLRTAVASVLAQTCSDFELIIADDGSGEETRVFLQRLANEPKVRVLWLAHSGAPSVVRNAAIRAARGRYLAFLDSDDVWLPEKLARQLALMRARPECAWSYHPCGRIDAAGREASSAGVRPWRAFEGDIVGPLLEIDAMIATPAVMVERTLVERVGAFDEGQRFCEDYDLWLRLALDSDAAVVDERLALIRVHDDNFSQDRLGAHLGWVRLYGKMLRLVPDAPLRAICRRRRALSSLSVASARWQRGGRGEALRDLLASMRDGWCFAPWWRQASALALHALVMRDRMVRR
jgi:glycosyltransferase involved in cell wall biosynthesis